MGTVKLSSALRLTGILAVALLSPRFRARPLNLHLLLLLRNRKYSMQSFNMILKQNAQMSWMQNVVMQLLWLLNQIESGLSLSLSAVSDGPVLFLLLL